MNIMIANFCNLISLHYLCSALLESRNLKKQKRYLNTHKPQVCYKHVFNKFLLNSIRNKEQTKIKKTVSADYGYSKNVTLLFL